MFKTLRTALFGMGAFLLAGGLLTVPAQASDYPSKPIQLVSPYGAGGDSDLTARVWAEFAKKKLGQPVVVVNKTGGGGLTGSLFAAKAKPDGYTLFLAQAGPNIIIPLTAKGANYSFDSFDYIARIMVANCAVVVNKDAPWNNLKEFRSRRQEGTRQARVRQPRRHLVADLRHAQLVHRHRRSGEAGRIQERRRSGHRRSRRPSPT